MQVTENLKGTLPSAAFVGLGTGAGVDTKPSELAFCGEFDCGFALYCDASKGRSDGNSLLLAHDAISAPPAVRKATRQGKAACEEERMGTPASMSV